jgi:tRNA-dihydrouridine synthase
MRSGIREDAQLEDIARAAESGGAVMITVHCRTREERYQDCADWRRVARAVAAVKVPVCGNGSIETHADLERMRRETGCRYAMVGRAVLGNPWVFSGRQVTAAEAARFLLDYAEALRSRRGFNEKGTLGRVKKLLWYWTAGGLFPDAAEKNRLLRDDQPQRLWAWLEERCAVVSSQGGRRRPQRAPRVGAGAEPGHHPYPRHLASLATRGDHGGGQGHPDAGRTCEG